MCVQYVCFGSKVTPKTFACIAMGSASVVYFEGQIVLIFCRVWSEQSASCFVWCEIILFCPGKKLYVSMVVCISWLHSSLCVCM